MSGIDPSMGARRAVAGEFAPVGRDLAAGLLGLLVLTLATWGPLGLPASYLVQPAALYLLLCGLIVRGGPEPLSGPGLGAPNRVTLARATLVLTVAALAFHPSALDASALWWVVALSTVALALDGVDGRIARRTGSVTRFGARFDMELDAFLILVLSMLVWLAGQAGAWVLLIGALRYLFLGAGSVWPFLRAELPPSRRRSAICLGQGVVLVLCLAPIVPPALASALAAGALGLLLYSFAADVWWLAGRTR